jgi:hypothetical protein
MVGNIRHKGLKGLYENGDRYLRKWSNVSAKY